MLEFNEYQHIREELKQLNEKLIITGKGKRYGQVIFLAGGGGSGKGFAIKNFIDSSSFKVRDVDELEVSFLKLAELKNKFPEIRGLDLRRPKDVFALHMFVKDKGIYDKSLELLLGQAKTGKLPNIIVDATFKDLDILDNEVKMLIQAGYDPKDLHVIWVLSNYHIAVQQNKSRSRIVPDDILLKTHEGAALTMYNMIQGNMPAALDGEFYVILSGAKHSVFYTDPKTGKPLDGRDGRMVIKDFKYFKLKEPGRPIISDGELKDQVLYWIRNSVPKSKATKDIFGSGKDMADKLT